MGTNECSQPASKSSWDSQYFGDINMVLKMAHLHKSSRPQWVNADIITKTQDLVIQQKSNTNKSWQITEMFFFKRKQTCKHKMWL